MSKRSPSGKKGAPRMSEADLVAFRQKHGEERVHDPMEGRAALLALDVPAARFQSGPQRLLRRTVTDPALAALLPLIPEDTSPAGASGAGNGGTVVKVSRSTVTLTADGKRKRRGVELAPIMASLKHPVREAVVGDGDDGPTLSLWFAGARLLTVNDLFSILPFRKYDIWAYKKRWKALIQEALLTLAPGTPVPLFDGPTRLVLFRRGANKIDLDSFQTVFKYAIDGLRQAGVLIEDNPEIMVETVPEQHLGAPAVGVRLERLLGWVAPEPVDLHQRWFGTVEPAAPLITVVRSRASRQKPAPTAAKASAQVTGSTAKPRARATKRIGAISPAADGRTDGGERVTPKDPDDQG